MLIGFSYPQECEEPVNVWFKLSNDTSSKDYGETIAIDMSRGYASTDGVYIYLFTYVKDSDEGVIISFPIGYWEVETKSEFQKELEKEFKNLEDYLKNKGNGTEIKKQSGR
tara:strand:+ start:232 stop:564 length:333 start_codon:yes stop_codon:yes gene_type:complete